MIRRAEARDCATVVRVLGAAFADDAVANYMLRKAWIPRAFGTFFEHTVLPHREAWIADDDGVALWTPPGKWDTSGLRLVAMGPTLLAAAAGRMMRSARGAQRVQKKHPTAPHYYLFAIGVDPAKQGRGIGSKLLRHVLDRCDEEKSAAYLEASSESNMRLYARNGFEVTEEFKMAPDAPPVWLMWREPR